MKFDGKRHPLSEHWPTHVAVAAALVIGIFAVYAQVGAHQYLNIDDDVYIVNNPHIRSGLSWANVGWAFTHAYEAYWLPLTWISFMADMQMWGLDAGRQLLENVAMHAAGSVLLYVLFFRLTGAPAASAWVAAVFGLHPIHVESVAWVSQRKDVLSTLFWMLTALAYVRYVHAPSKRNYAWVMIPFATGLLTKPTLVTLPFVLLLLDAWPLGRKDKTPAGLLFEKLPLFAVAAVAATVTFFTQSGAGAVRNLSEMPLADRLANVCHSYVAYMGMLLWPVDLAIFYPLAPVAPASAAAAAVCLLAATVLAIRFAVRAPWFAVGWFWYLGVLVPVIGFVQVGGQALADRYLHVASVGLTVALAWFAKKAAEGNAAARGAIATLAAISVFAMGALTYHQLGYWTDSITIFERTLSVTEENFFAHNNLGEALAAAGRSEEAGRHYEEAVRIHPGYPPARNNLGTYLAKRGDLDEAARNFEAALEVDPTLSAAENNLATIYARTGRAEMAVEHYRRALRLDPDNPYALLGLGDVLMMTGRPAEAEQAYRATLKLAPDWVNAASGLERARRAAGSAD